MTRLGIPLLLASLLGACAHGGRYSVRADVPYAEPGGERLAADVYVPEGEGPFPAVLVVHGGGWYKGRRGHMDDVSRMLARRGFVAVNISYRFAPKHVFPAQVHDCKQAVRWLRANAAKYRIDPARVGGFGYSAGAHLVGLLATTSPEDGLEGEAPADAPGTRLQAAVMGGTPADLSRFPRSSMVRDFLGTTFEKSPETYKRASPVSYATADDPPVFLFHGGFDRLVYPEQASLLAEALRAKGVEARTRFIAGLGHVAVFVWDLGVEPAIDFLESRLK